MVMSIKDVLNFLFPPCCPVCHTRTMENLALCSECYQKIKFNVCESILNAYAVEYNETTKQIILPLKYGDRTDFAVLMGNLMVQAGENVLKNTDLLVPVPIHWTRLLSRKYNQAGLLANQISKKTKIKVGHTVLKRVKHTEKQGSAKQRFENVKNAFVCKKDVQGKRIVLIDDVYTTGATIEACRKVLEKAGAKEVKSLVFAKRIL
ncbi:MAG: ComF family protein [Alphaproteobacteria bacterium]|nr:ComF family protein [Alphaproteobacteria bacterium]